MPRELRFMRWSPHMQQKTTSNGLHCNCTVNPAATPPHHHDPKPESFNDARPPMALRPALTRDRPERQLVSRTHSPRATRLSSNSYIPRPETHRPTPRSLPHQIKTRTHYQTKENDRRVSRAEMAHSIEFLLPRRNTQAEYCTPPPKG